MKFCESHWDALRKAINDRGLSPFVARDGAVASAQLAKQLTENRSGKDTFDPLMAAHWSVAGNAMKTLERAGINPLYLMNDDALAPPGRNACPVCELNIIHKESCTNPRCRLDKERGYDWMIDRAADDALRQARHFGLVQ